jgi:hypothetical protein
MGFMAGPWQKIGALSRLRLNSASMVPVDGPNRHQADRLLTLRWQQGLRMLYLHSGGIRHARYGLFPGV